MTNKQSNEEKQHTDRELTEETSLPSTEANSKNSEAKSSNEDNLSIKEKDDLEDWTELDFDEEAQADEEALTAAKELDQLDQEASDEGVEMEVAELAETTKSDAPSTEQEGLPVSEEEVEEDSREQRRKKRRERKPRLRLIPIWLRILISVVLIGGSLILGVMFGYGVIGGGEPGEAIKPETWYHIIDIIRGN